MTKLYIHTPFIRLKDALKFAGAVENGSAAKMDIQDGKVKVNGEKCTVNGKKLQVGDQIEYEGIIYLISHDFAGN